MPRGSPRRHRRLCSSSKPFDRAGARPPRGGPSRADLTALTGLNRSTIGALVGELVELGLVQETDPSATNRVGRPSRRVLPDPRARHHRRQPRDRRRARSPSSDSAPPSNIAHGTNSTTSRAREETAAVIGDLVADLRAGPAKDRRIIGVGLAVPGLVRASDGRGAVGHRTSDGARSLPRDSSNPSSACPPSPTTTPPSAHSPSGCSVSAAASTSSCTSTAERAASVGASSSTVSRTEAAATRGSSGTTAPRLDDPRTGGRGHPRRGGQPSTAARHPRRRPPTNPTSKRPSPSSDDPGVAAELARQQVVLGGALGNAINVLGPELVVLGGFLATLSPGRARGARASVAGAGDARRMGGTSNPRRRPRRGPPAHRRGRARLRRPARRPARALSRGRFDPARTLGSASAQRGANALRKIVHARREPAPPIIGVGAREHPREHRDGHQHVLGLDLTPMRPRRDRGRAPSRRGREPGAEVRDALVVPLLQIRSMSAVEAIACSMSTSKRSSRVASGRRRKPRARRDSRRTPRRRARRDRGSAGRGCPGRRPPASQSR